MKAVTTLCRILPNMNTNTEQGSTPPFASLNALQSAFEQRLQAMLDIDQLGVFILVLANASFESAMFERMHRALATAFAVWKQRLDKGDPLVTEAAPDDQRVFEQLCRYGFDNLTPTRWRNVGPWLLQFNPMRAFRPPRMSGSTVDSLRRPFERDAFHFNKPFLRKEIFWEGELSDVPWRLLFNKFPFAPLHGLLVPQPSAEHPQFLTRAIHDKVWQATAGLGSGLPGVRVAYNAYGAFASVNHLHFQFYVTAEHTVYPIEGSQWLHNGGDEAYPLRVSRFDDASLAWHSIQELHDRGSTYNLIYRPGDMYLIVRALQGSYRQSEWTSGFAWSETAGAVTVFDEADFERLTAGDIDAELRALAITP